MKSSKLFKHFPLKYWFISVITMALIGFVPLWASAADEAKSSVAEKASESHDWLAWLGDLAPIIILITAIAIVISRLPKVDLGHSKAFNRRRVMNWLPLGLTYAFLYWGRYNLKVAQGALKDLDLMSLADFSVVFAVGTVVYGVSFIFNGPLTDRFGGKFAMLVGAGGAAICNGLLGIVTSMAIAGSIEPNSLVKIFAILYGLNMYFQSFGAVAIVKVNAPWFHVRERGVFGAIFGILISLGVYFAFDWSSMILKYFPGEKIERIPWVFILPAIGLALLWIIDFFIVKNTPGEAGFDDFDTADASSGDDGPRLPAIQVFKKMLSNPIIMTIALVEFCSGFLRQAIMQYYPGYVKAVGDKLPDLAHWVIHNWGLLLCCAGILGGTFAGIISDKVFGSRRGPVAAVLYAVMITGGLIAIFTLTSPIIGLLFVTMSMAIIGVHGMLSGTASMDFGGKKNVGVAVGIIDGFVYLGTATMAFTYSIVLPSKEIDPATGMAEAADPNNWQIWPITIVIVAVIGFLLAKRLWNAKPQGKSSAAH